MLEPIEIEKIYSFKKDQDWEISTTWMPIISKIQKIRPCSNRESRRNGEGVCQKVPQSHVIFQ